MKNYQLYKTNVLLSGQVKWDIIIGSYNGELYVQDFHLNPISKNIHYDEKISSYILNNNHQYNVKKLYDGIKGDFYNTPTASYLNSYKPVIYEKNSKRIPYNDEYFEGCTRSVYGLYNKSFEYLCPTWVEYIREDENLCFNIEIIMGENNIISKKLILKYLDNSNPQFFIHNKFINYIRNYLNDIRVLYSGDKNNRGSDVIMDINFHEKTAYINGLNVTTGEIETKDISSIIDDLLLRERPLMEFDSILTNSFKSYGLITNNLLNFNICFNAEDILSHSITDRMYGNSVRTNIDIGLEYNGIFTYFDRSDIYSNYEYIPRKLCGKNYNIVNGEIIVPSKESPGEDPNVLNYLRDNEYIDIIDKNKKIQKICHWQLSENDDYIFNLYGGFGGYIEKEIDGEFKYSLIQDRYASAPDISLGKYDAVKNNAYWTNIFNINKDNYNYVLNNFQLLINNGYIPLFQEGWNNFIKYNYSDTPLYVFLGIITDDMDLKSLEDKKTSIYINNILIHSLGIDNNVLFICGKNYDDLTIQRLSYTLKLSQSAFLSIGFVNDGIFITNSDIFDYPSTNEPNLVNLLHIEGTVENNTLYLNSNLISNTLYESIKKLNKLLSSIVDVPVVHFENSLVISLADGPSINTTEIEYYKQNGVNINLYRYDGKIKPCFGYGNNYIYHKIVVGDDDTIDNIKAYNTFKRSKYIPRYKSINYYDTNGIILDYNTPIKFIEDNYEYKWFNQSKNIILPQILNLTIQVDMNSDVDKINEEILNMLKIELSKTIIYEKTADYYLYIFDLYDIDYKLIELDNNKMSYDIKLTLK